MTTVMVSFIAVVLFGMVMLATLSYGDSLGIMSTNDSLLFTQRLQSAAEIVSQVETSTGSRPRSGQEIMDAGMPKSTVSGLDHFEVDCSANTSTCHPMHLCLRLPGSLETRKSAEITADRLKGENGSPDDAFVSGTCDSFDHKTDPVTDTVIVFKI